VEAKDCDHSFCGSSNRAFEERSHWLVWLKLDPFWDTLRSDARFTQVVERMHFPGCC
jgi:hypothetical protein